jgi:TnpA family transposase
LIIFKNYQEYILLNDGVIHNRLEFLLYKQIAHNISTNKLTLEYSVKYKRIEDDLMPKPKWNKNKKTIIDELDFPKLKQPTQEILKTKQTELNKLYKMVNDDILSGKNQDIIITTKENSDQQWRLRPLEAGPDANDSLLAGFQQRSIVDVIQFVDNKTKFTRAFESILPKSKKGELDTTLTMAVVLANAIRMGVRKMADISDLKEAALVTAEAAYVRTETLMATADIINNAAAKLPIYKGWYINSILHGSLDGLKLETSLRNILARHSSKYFGTGVGVSAYNEIVNCFPLAGYLIGTHDYEGNHSFEMVHHQNTSEIKPKKISTDKHGTNTVNFGLFDFTDMIFAPRIPKPHRETLWGFGGAKDYEGMIIKPTKFIDEQLIIDEEDNIRHLVASLLAGDSRPSTVIRKLAAKDYRSKTKEAFVQYNNIVKSQFLLSYLHNPEFRRAILVSLNRGEEYNGLYRAITLLKKGELRGRNEIEMEVWHQCTRLISTIMLYYSSYILNSLYVTAETDEEKEFLLRASPCARSHINLLGYYQFCDLLDNGLLDQWIKQWDWKKVADIGR